MQYRDDLSGRSEQVGPDGLDLFGNLPDLPKIVDVVDHDPTPIPTDPQDQTPTGPLRSGLFRLFGRVQNLFEV